MGAINRSGGRRADNPAVDFTDLDTSDVSF
jgi:hypothetical protein